MNIIICPGIHHPSLTQSFTLQLHNVINNSCELKAKVNILRFPGENYLSLSAFHIVQFLSDRLDNQASPVVFICFSAGVVGGIMATWLWQLLSGKVAAFIAIDGWCVPLGGNFAIHRVSHNYFTHWSSNLFGSALDNFYADPAVEHLSIWRSPHQVTGQWVDTTTINLSSRQNSPRVASSKPLTAAEFLHILLNRYQQN